MKGGGEELVGKIEKQQRKIMTTKDSDRLIQDRGGQIDK